MPVVKLLPAVGPINIFPPPALVDKCWPAPVPTHTLLILPERSAPLLAPNIVLPLASVRFSKSVALLPENVTDEPAAAAVPWIVTVAPVTEPVLPLIVVMAVASSGVDHVPSPRQKVVLLALVPLFKLFTPT